MNNPETIARAQETLDYIREARGRQEAEAREIFARGWLGALLIEELIDKAEHDRLLALALEAVERVAPSQLPKGGGFQQTVSPPPRY